MLHIIFYKMNFTAVTLPRTLFNLQKIYFSCDVNNKFYAKIVYVHLDSETFICKVYSKPFLPCNLCLIDKTVLCSETDIEHETVASSNVKLIEIPTVEHIKKVSVVVIFNTAWERQKWENNNLKKLLKQVLQFFIIQNNSIVNISDVAEFKKLGISVIQIVNIGSEHVGKVVNSTRIKIDKCMCMEHYRVTNNNRLLVSLLTKAYGELEEVFLSRSKVTESATLPLPQVLLIGPPGCGKKTVVKTVCNNTHSILQIIDCTELCRPEPGETEALLKKRFQYATILSKECMVVLLLLRVEVIGCKYGKVLLQLNSLLDSVMSKANLIIILPSCNPNILHDSLKSRFLHQIYIGPPKESERSEMLAALCDDMNLSIESFDEIAKFTPGFVIADLLLLSNRVRRYLCRNGITDFRSADVTLFKKFVYAIEPSILRGELGIVKSKQRMEDIGGLEGIKKSLLQLVQWPLLHHQAFKSLNIKHPSGILLFGPPGCAKTTLVRAIASLCNITFLAVSAADLYSPFVGDAEQTISHLFQRARAASPSLLFIDEIDALVGCRGGRQKGAQERVLSAFLTEMDGVGYRISDGIITTNELDNRVIVIAATNRPNVLDSALLRPGRLDRLLYVPPPNYKDRIDILTVLCKNIAIDECVNLETIAMKTELFTGADLSSLCREAALEALTWEGMNVNAVQNKHFMSVLKNMKPSLTENHIKWYSEFNFIS